MTDAADDLARLGASPHVRAALAALPDGFAAAFASEAVRLVEGGRVPVRPADAAPMLPASMIQGAARCVLMMDGLSPPGVASLPVARFRILSALLRGDAGRLLAACNAFRAVVLPSWEEAHGRRLAPAGEDWPPLPSREF